MITIKQLRWSNAFSYGPDNRLDFDKAPLTQLVGKNGHGKSSIALILEEVLFNKNSKSIKKSDILNRYVRDRSYAIELDFERDGTEYTIKSQRASTQTVKLFKAGEDISSHTATATYKQIEEILGFDHKTFAQIVYQSHASSLEFLTAPDTARKKFLIEILNLDHYTRAQEVFKTASQELSKDIATVQAKVTTVQTWLTKYQKQNLDPQPLTPVPSLDQTLVDQAQELKTSLSSVEQTNKRIAQNNTYKQMLDSIELVAVPEAPKTDIVPLQNKSATLQKTILDAEQFVKKMQALHGTCPTCLSRIDEAKVEELVAEKAKEQETARVERQELERAIDNAKQMLKQYQTSVTNQAAWEKYHQLIDHSLPDTQLDKLELQESLTKLEESIQATRREIQLAQQQNQQAAAHNSKVELLKNQLDEMTEELETHSAALQGLTERMSLISVLNKTFSTTGLVAYKIECLVKDLEQITNYYLVDLSDGRFQISFKVSSSDKLNVVITDNGKDIEVLALSGGERARVNIATLLAIRKLMQTLSSSRVNLLILDETVETLDLDGKERLVEVLLREEHLNTFLVSHSFSHPLIERVHIVKTDNISFIES
jgi:DNA repair exonuclease SbcCD ATPase subunit